jgi:hypothetical protein
VSIGGEDDDRQELAAFQTRESHPPSSGDENSPNFPLKPLPDLDAGAKQEEPIRGNEDVRSGAQTTSPRRRSKNGSPRGSRKSSRRSRPTPTSSPLKTPLTHALPPKPVATLPPSEVRQDVHRETTEAKLMSTNRRNSEREASHSEGRKIANSPEPAARDDLPPNWVIRHPTKGNREDIYYYNTITSVSQWERPTLDIPEARATTKRDEVLENRVPTEPNRHWDRDDRIIKSQSNGDVEELSRPNAPLLNQSLWGLSLASGRS